MTQTIAMIYIVTGINELKKGTNKQTLHFTEVYLLAKAFRFIKGADTFDYNYLVLVHCV